MPNEFYILVEDVHVSGVEDQFTHSEGTVRVISSELTNDPLCKTDREIDIVLEVSEEVCTSHEVTDVQDPITNDEVITKGAGDSFSMNCSSIFWKPDR
jgi:hypothetical protein